jgi:ribonuclease HI
LVFLSASHKFSPDSVIISEFNSTRASVFPSHSCIYTDGSKSPVGVGAAFTIPSLDYSESFKLPSFCSIFSAESLAILRAIAHISSSSYTNNFLIVSDAKSVLLAITSPLPPPSADPIILLIRLLVFQLSSRRSIRVDFLWVPGHAGIGGNEQADVLARSAACNGRFLVKFPASDIIFLSKNCHSKLWRSIYPSLFSNPQSFYLSIQPCPPPRPWFQDYPHLRRSFISAFSRLRFNHNLLPSSLFRFSLISSLSCPFHINDSSLICDANHIFFECSALCSERSCLYSQLLSLSLPTPYSASYILSPPATPIVPSIVDFLASLCSRIRI